MKTKTQILERIITNLTYLTSDMIREFLYDTPELRDICYQTKNDSKEYGYYHNNRVTDLMKVINTYNIISVIDLGCGVGLICKILSYFDIYVKGFDNEPKLIEMGNKISRGTLHLKDILTLTKDDLIIPEMRGYKISGNQALYFWEPLRDIEMIDKFFTNLEQIMTKDQHIIYLPAGPMYDRLMSSKYFIELKRIGPYLVFKYL